MDITFDPATFMIGVGILVVNVVYYAWAIKTRSVK
jgi:hypothetical protein